MVTGRMSGHDEAGYHTPSNAKATTKTGGAIWESTPESFRELWGEVERETDTKWVLGCWMWKFGTHSAMEAEGEEGKLDRVGKAWFRSKESGICIFICERVK